MFSLRALSRSAPRAVARAAGQSMRQPISASSLTRSTLIRSSLKQATASRMTAAFSTSRARYDTNQELVAKLDSELMMEKEIRNSEAYSEDVKAFLDNSPFELHDTPGQEEVTLSRTMGDETIRVTFSISDINNLDHDADENQDPAMFDEDATPEDLPTDTQSGGATTKGSVNQGMTRGGNIKVAPEDNVAPADREDMSDESVDDEQPQEASFPARVTVTVERPGKGALSVEALAESGEIMIENVAFFSDAELAHAKTAEKDHAKRSLYTGPPFNNLDEDLQILLERYLDERGINTSMALFIPDYIDFKEQKEYLRWLSNLKAFVE